MAKVDKTLQEEAMVTQIIDRLARKYNCTFKINYDNHTITFEGDERVKVELAKELEKFFDCY